MTDGAGVYTDPSSADAGRQQRRPKLRPSDLWVRNGFEQAAIGLAIIDSSTRHTLVNAAYMQQTALPKSKLVGLGLADVVSQQSRHLVRTWAQTPKQPTTIEVTIDRAGHGPYDATLFLSPIDSRESDRHVLVQLVGADSSQTSRDTSARLRVIVEHLDELVLMTRANGALTYVSPSAERALAAPGTTLIGAALAELVHPDDMAAMLGAERTARSSTVEASMRLRGPNGGWFPHDFRIAEVRDQLGRLLGQAYLARPTALQTPVHSTQLAVPQPDLRTPGSLSILTQTSDLIWQFDRDRPIYANPAARTMIGLGADESLDHVELSRIHPRWSVERIALQAIPETLVGSVWKGEVSVLDNEGDEVPVSFVLAGHRDPTGAVTHWSSTSRLVDRDARSREQAGWATTHDPLTSLPGRVLLVDRMEVALSRSTRTGQRVGLLLLDLDFFETVNMSVGSDIADRLLKTTAERLRTSIRPGDTVGRMADDEFAVLCEHFDHLDAAEKFAKRLLDIVEEPIVLDGAEWFVSMSLGVALARQGITTADRLMSNASAAMYRAKELGRGRHVVFGNTLTSPELPLTNQPGTAAAPDT